MKKLLFSLIAVTGFTLSSNAQTEKGTLALGGRINYSNEKYEYTNSSEGKYTSFNLTPQVHYFIKNDLALGLSVGYSQYKEDKDYIGKEFSIAPSVRKYYNLGSQFKAFAEIAVPFYFGNEKDLDNNNKVTTKNYDENGFGIYLSPGVAFFASKNIAIELQLDGLYYESETREYSNNDTRKYKEFGFRGNLLNPSIGARFHF